MLFCAFAASFIRLEFSVLLSVCLFFGCIGFLFFGKRFYKVSALFAAAVLGFGLVSCHLVTEIYPAKALDGTSTEISGTVKEVSAAGGNPVFTVETDYVGIEGAPQKITVLISGWEENFASPFDKISCSVNFRVYSEDEIGEIMTNRSGGISLYGYTNSPIEIIGKEDSSFRYYIYRIREKISSIIYTYYIDWHAPFIEQILIGTRGELKSEIASAFRRSGMSHILAISGMHLVIITGTLKKALFFFKGHDKAKEWILIFAIGIYMFIGGLGMSILRSGLMLILRHLSRLLFSGSKSVDSLGIAVAAILLLDPFAACDVGFLMSVTSCLAISVFVKPFCGFLTKLFRCSERPFAEFLIGAFSLSSVASLSVLPISAVVFGEVSLASPFSNLFAGFFVQYALIFGIFTVIFGAVPFLGFIAGGSAFCGMICSGILFKIASFFSGFSFAYIETSKSWVLIWMFCSAVLIILPMLISKSFRYLKHSALTAVFVLLAGILCNLVFFSGVSEIKISALEHGTSVLCSKDGETVLIAKGLSENDSFELNYGGNYDVFISLEPSSGAAEYKISMQSKPRLALLSTDDSLDKYSPAKKLSAGTVLFSEESRVKIIPDSAFMLETNGVTLLYIFAECDIMEIEPKFRRADIIILDGVSPEDYPSLRADYLILRKMCGFYSGAGEIITLKSGEVTFFAHEGILTKGRYAK